MIIARTVKRALDSIKKVKRNSCLTGLVPTMGAFHKGHLSLIEKARKECDFLAVSIFVNPKQFAPGEDYEAYPRSFSRDRKLLLERGVDLLFCPPVRQMYARDFSTYVNEFVLSRNLCGLSRPGHFQGVCTVVAKLFNVLSPDIAYFGAKDYQQALIIKRMTRDLNFPVKIKVLPIVREKSGLALSSRNDYLSGKTREGAGIIYSALDFAKDVISKGNRDVPEITSLTEKFIKKRRPGVKIDYIKFVDPVTLEDIPEIKGKTLMALAVFIDDVRLIDNLMIGT